MDVRFLTLAGFLAAVFSQEVPQLCQKSSAGGLGCRCTSSITEMVLSRYDVDCSARNITSLPHILNISQLARSLDLSRNVLTSLSNEQFSPWGNLEELNLSRNRFTTLNENVFSGLTSLRVLDLSYNSLTDLSFKIFNGLTLLSELNLEKNNLRELHPLLFGPTPHLKSLSLSYNLDLGANLKRSLDALIVVLNNSLESLTMNNMSIASLPKDLFSEDTNLKYVSLADNPIDIVDYLPPSLEEMNLSGTAIDIIFPGDFINYPKLRKLHLDRLLHLRAVKVNAFEGLTSLEVLTMENCVQLNWLDEFVFGSGNDSKSVPLREFSLARSGLHSLKPGVLMAVKSTLKQVDLQGNPWRCDCKLSWFQNIDVSLKETQYLRCFYPEEHHNKLILSLSPDDFVCGRQTSSQKQYRSYIAMLDVVLIMLVLVVCGAILAVLWRKGFRFCRPRDQVGSYSHIVIDPNRAELEWDDRDLDHIWTTPAIAKKHNTPPSP